MKYVIAFILIGCLINTFLLIQLGFNYQAEGYGLHPALALIGVLVSIAIGWTASAHLEILEA